MTNPITTKPTTDFAQSISESPVATNTGAEPTAAGSVNTFKLKLKLDGTTLGYLGQDDSQWGKLVVDSSKALVLEKYVDTNGTYYRIKGTSRYMSVNARAAIGFYGWSGATTFKMEGEYLVASYNKQKLSIYSTDYAYLYAWNDYKVLEVEEVPQ